jgi:BTB/POZ domain
MTSTATVSYDSDEEPPAESMSHRLLWRKDPDESRSDWIIHVIVKSTKSNDDSGGGGGGGGGECKDDNANDELHPVIQSFHVHTQNLTVGPRRSEYFVQQVQESIYNVTTVELYEIAAKQLPVLLDFVYSSEKDDPISFTAANATALYSLAKYFQMHRLQYLAKQFWQVDIWRGETCEIYYHHAKILQQDNILQAATRSWTENIMKLTECSRHLLDSPNVKLFLLDLEKDSSTATAPFLSTEYRLHLSRHIGNFLSNNALDPRAFRKLTTEKFLPKIHADAALLLLDAERRLLLHSATDRNEDAQTTLPNKNHKLTSLQERCIQSIISNQFNIDWSENSTTMRLLFQQSPWIHARILSSIATSAKTANQELENCIRKFKTLQEAHESLLRRQRQSSQRRYTPANLDEK